MNIGNKLSVVKAAVSSTTGRSLLKGQKHSPVILFAAGVVGFGATVVLASKATLKLDGVITEHERKLGSVHDAHELNKLGKNDYTEKDLKHDKAALKLRFIKDVSKLYAPAAVVGIASVAALTGSHVILTKRNTGLMAAYATLDQSYKEYRKRVEERFGTDVDRELKYGVEKADLAVVDEQTGEVAVQNTKFGKKPSQYARIWSKDTSTSWSPQADYNLVTLRAHQSYANETLRLRGHVMLNDVYDMLGLDRTPDGFIVGWVKGNGNDFIDFGIFDREDRFIDFMTGREGAILLDFNVDGVVFDKI